jgi:GNAT superfamily N-acetyltransferase
LDEDVTHLFEGLRKAEVFLSERLGKPVEVRASTTLDEAALGMFESVDHRAFKEELWYSRDEIASKSRRNGFIAFTVLVDGELMGMLYGYELDPSTFFLDEVVALNEGKGIGKSLVKLLIQHCVAKGYGVIRLYTEEVDEKGRRLRAFYEGLGFRLSEAQPEQGIEMCYILGEPLNSKEPRPTVAPFSASRNR